MRGILMVAVAALVGCGSSSDGVPCGANRCSSGQICCNLCGNSECFTGGCPGIQCTADMASRPDLSTVDQTGADQAGADLATTQTFACGKALCTGGNGCCTSDKGVTGSCMPIAQGCSGAPRFDCGGPDNCVAGAVCCLAQGSADCLPAADCAAAGGQSLCHDASSCGGGNCCALAPGSSFSACATGICP
jgi:hypothetical protein